MEKVRKHSEIREMVDDLIMFKFNMMMSNKNIHIIKILFKQTVIVERRIQKTKYFNINYF